MLRSFNLKKVGLVLGVAILGQFSIQTMAQDLGPGKPPQKDRGVRGGWGNDRDLAERVRRLERQNEDLERSFRNFELEVSDRLRRIERDLGGQPTPRPGERNIVCRIRDSFRSGSYLGRGKNELVAETLARQECGKSVQASYCDDGKAQCEADYPGNSASCVVVDGFRSASHLGEATSEVEAAHKAQVACEATVHPSYCATTPRCESTRRFPR